MKNTGNSLTHESERRDLLLDRNPPIRSETLFAAGDELLIEHQGQRYRLRRTRAGKLILTK
ncbi:MAG: hemin uptake protein HemP [Betaproteobacteria bacterium]|nr:hemin uptake protein HemP [Betaproteobacteria bacterium]